MSFVKLTVLGNLGQDPEKKEVNGTAVCTFSVAATESHGSGEDKKEHTEWVSLEAWGQLAELCSKYLKKGSQVYVEATPRTSSWEDNGQKRTRTVHRIKTIQFLDKKPQE